MKSIILAATILLSSTAQAAWYAEATSTTAYGWGESYNRQQAINIAINNCVARTPYWDTCYLATVYWR